MNRIELSKENKQELIDDIKKFFWDERSENLSDFQAELMLDFIVNIIGPRIYNQAITDAHKLMNEKIEELYALEIRRYR